MRKIGWMVFSALVNAAVTLFLLWQYDRRYSPRVYVIDVSRIAQAYVQEIAQGKMTMDDLEERLRSLNEKIEAAVGSSRAVILRKEAVVGGAFEEIQVQ